MKRKPLSLRARTPLLAGIVVFCAGCLSYQRQGDRAFDEKDYERALDYYEEAIKEGSKDAEMFHNAAKASLALGSFATAERYFSQSLRYGGGLDVARDLADFYVKTSNFTSAVRVYQYLLYQHENPQPLYNNLGTALMYAGQPFDAESYLLVAQQMNPQDPVPYVNLGVLYDRHLQQPWLAINFYDCFVSMARSSSGREVEQRSAELRQKWGRLYDEEAVSCGKAYEPAPSPPVGHAKAVIDLDKLETTGPADQGAGPTTVPVIEGMSDASPEPAKAPQKEPVLQPDLLAQAADAYNAKQWAVVVAKLSTASLDLLDDTHFAMLGHAYLEESNWERAVRHLRHAVNEKPTPERVAWLMRAYSGKRDDQGILGLCKKYLPDPEYANVMAVCPRADKAAQSQ